VPYAEPVGFNPAYYKTCRVQSEGYKEQNPHKGEYLVLFHGKIENVNKENGKIK
jgi:hypothetical protein